MMAYNLGVCSQHKNYKGKSFPTQECLECWRVYFDEHGSEPITGRVMVEFLGIQARVREHFAREVAERICEQITTNLQDMDWW